MRVAALIAVFLTAALVAGCGPMDATQSGGERVRPVALLDVLPSPGALRGDPAAPADGAALARAFTGRADPDLAQRIDARNPSAAAVRTWRSPDGGELVTAITVWDAKITATGVGSDLATDLVEEGGRAWTPEAVRGSRGARRDAPRELRLTYAVGPNAMFVRASGPVDEATVIRAMNRLIEVAPAFTE